MPSEISNTLAVPCSADELVDARTRVEVLAALERASRTGRPLTVLGECSNAVLMRRIPGIVLRVAIGGIDWRSDDTALVGAGVSWDSLVRMSLDRGLAGLENLSAIPGSVGAAPFQNIGAYGRELAQVVRSVHAIERATGDEVLLPPDACAFGYRDSRFKTDDRDRFIIVAVEIEFNRLDLDVSYADVADALGRRERTAVEVSRVVREVRAAKLPDPRRHPNAGSFFKNPVLSRAVFDELRGAIDIRGFEVGEAIRVPAARLIEAAGWKDKPGETVEVWRQQPLVIINRGGARGSDVLDFAARIRDDVFDRYGIRLEQEPVTIGED